MGIATVVNYNFALSLFQEGSVPSIYVSVENEREGKQYLNSAPVSPKELSSKITEVKCIPEFLIPLPHSLGSHLKKLELRRINGFYIDLAGFSSVDDYMAAELGSKRRSLKRQLRRLESCFDISYKAYFGHIEKEQYDALFDKMLQFLESRFDQRGDVFDPTINLDVMRKRCYPMILEKRASLHVIYNQSDPIDICVNYHFQDVMSSAISSYDIDYSKFGLGNLDIVKQLEWCFDNDHRIFDLMWGEMPYKYSWCNKVYQYAHHIFYNPRSLAHRLLVPLRIFAYKAKDYLKSKKIKEFKAKIGFGPKKKVVHESTCEVREISPGKEADELLSLPYHEIDIYLEPHVWLKAPVFNFQYRHVVHFKDVSVRSYVDKPDTYLILGKNKEMTIVNKKK